MENPETLATPGT